MPRVAALLDVMQISEIIVKAPHIFERPIYAGNAIVTVQSTNSKKVITVRTAAFQPAGERTQAPVERIGADAAAEVSRFKDETLVKSERPELGAARIIISGGRGMQSADNFRPLSSPLRTS